VGWIGLVQEYDIRDYGKVKEAVQYSDVVFNLAGRDYVTRCGCDALHTLLITTY
jgi:hypothetical protein